jgi:hypothetical protein
MPVLGYRESDRLEITEMNRLLTGAALIAALTATIPAFAATPGAPQPLGGPYVPETAPSPPSVIAPAYAYPPYWGGYYRGYYRYGRYSTWYGY